MTNEEADALRARVSSEIEMAKAQGAVSTPEMEAHLRAQLEQRIATAQRQAREAEVERDVQAWRTYAAATLSGMGLPIDPGHQTIDNAVRGACRIADLMLHVERDVRKRFAAPVGGGR